MRLRNLLLGLGLLTSTVSSIEVDVEDKESVKEAAATAAWGLVRFYSGNETGDVPGNLPDPYYWWLCGAMMGTLIDYWHFTGDDSYNELVQQAIIHQAGRDRDLLPLNQSRAMGNDDQGFWGMTAMLAAEYVFPDPSDDEPQWLSLAMAVYNAMVSRWDEEHCNGGLRWQVYNVNVGWNYKNSVSNGCFFNIASRLALYTGNTTYAERAASIWDWEVEMGLITEEYSIGDGVTIHQGQKCQDDRDPTEWSYNSGIWLHGSAIMWKFTRDEKWKKRTEGILDYGLNKFTRNGIATEQFCEPNLCDDDQRSFKGYYLRWLAAVNALHPALADKTKPVIKKSAAAAAATCSGSPTEPIPMHPMFDGHPGTACGFYWLKSEWDGTFGVPEQMNAVAALLSVLDGEPPKTAKTGGTSKGDPNAGIDDEEKVRTFNPITMGDRVGAGIITTIIVAGVIAGSTFLVTDKY
ncbi:Mannan endo-1,6-alpha-mannosidase-like protein [Hapsidospora chrysogenum ATCC 11550]|uniref:Mannan endo-1,6-alpha-mannosidase n=1 Tax=Hapsidospora chrysogenum (strain ATCC 11550 / CBS 779.69 / DSM 880 / IAM 14645 / JCM 23072 / IMI 49137) TaxID=857340 RepID=A0A086TDY4_HAPC1|nr:Mannan endo-1,6-alpha-mannosidase-like protein [Hapsidospora chrysogenum ATCC 11550]